MVKQTPSARDARSFASSNPAISKMKGAWKCKSQKRIPECEETAHVGKVFFVAPLCDFQGPLLALGAEAGQPQVSKRLMAG
jgi:hypothetical protein